MSKPVSELRRVHKLRSEGRFSECLSACDQLLRQFPAWTAAREARGVALCCLQRFDEGLAEIRAAVREEPGNADFLCDLGFLAFVDDRLDEAREALERAVAHSPSHSMALANLSLVARASGDFALAESAARAALRVDPGRQEARINLAVALLAQGRYDEGWPAYAWRPAPHVNLRDPHLSLPVVPAVTLPASPAPLVVRGEQGLGDTLFFLRFAPALRARGHRLAFWGDARLHRLLAASGVFERLLPSEAMPAEGLAVLWCGELPALLQEIAAAPFPPPLPIPADAAMRRALREHLARLGPPPYIGLSWRAGLPRAGRVALHKSLPTDALAQALRGLPGTFVSLQRQPEPGELTRLAEALGRPLHDAASANERLDEAFSLLAALDEYVAVSNTNVHLRAGAGLPSRVLVPWPPEWRWPPGADSPWFPGTSVYRQAPDGDWTAPLARLREEMQAARK